MALAAPGSGLPGEGSLAFFVNAAPGAPGADTFGAVRFVADHMALPEATPPPDTPPLFGDSYSYHFRWVSDPAAAPRSFPRWPVRPVALDLPPDADERAIDEIAQALPGGAYHALKDAPSLVGDPDLFHAVHLFAGALAGAMGDRTRRMDEARAAIAQLESEIAALTPPPPARSLWQRLLGRPADPPPAPTAPVRQRSAALGNWGRTLADAEEQAGALAPVLAEMADWAAQHPPEATLGGDDLRRLDRVFSRFSIASGRWPRPEEDPQVEPLLQKAFFGRFSTLGEMAWQTRLWLIGGDAAHRALLPPGMIRAIDAGRLLPDRMAGVHHLFGRGQNVQTAAEAQGDLLLLQLASDSMVRWMWGDVGVMQFWIAPAALAASDWSRVVVTLEGH